MKPEHDLFENHRPTLASGFWVPTYPTRVCDALMRSYKPEIIRYWAITNVLMSECLIKWDKRLIPLTDEQLLAYFPDYKPEETQSE